MQMTPLFLDLEVQYHTVVTGEIFLRSVVAPMYNMDQFSLTLLYKNVIIKK